MSTKADALVYNVPEVNSGTTTSWVPLTTAWPSSTGCASSFYRHPGQPYPYGWDPGLGYFFGQTQKCLPAAVTAWHEQYHQDPDGFTSLSIRPIVCPAAYTTAATSINLVSSTMVVCCPSAYDLIGYEPGRTVGTCRSPLTSGQTITFLASSTSGIFTTSLAIKSATSINAVIIRGWNVATATPSPTTSTLLSTNNSTNTLSTTPGGLSSGTKTGIGIGATLGAIGILALIGALFLLRRRQKITQYEHVGMYPPQQADSSYVHEMSGQQPLAEMLQEPAELSSVTVKK